MHKFCKLAKAHKCSIIPVLLCCCQCKRLYSQSSFTQMIAKAMTANCTV